MINALTYARAKRLLSNGVFTLVPILFLEGARWAAGESFSWPGFMTRLIFVALLFFFAGWGSPYLSKISQGVPGLNRWPGLLVGIIGGIAGLLYLLTQTTWSAWLTLGLFYGWLLRLNKGLENWPNAFIRWAGRGGLAVMAGSFPAVIGQVETNFTNEEFFIVAQAFVLACFWLLLSLAGPWPPRLKIKQLENQNQFNGRWQLIVLAILIFLGLLGTVNVYQRSFFSETSPTYPGISADTPFLCEHLDQHAPDTSSPELEAQLVKLLTNVPDKDTVTLGNLALYTGQLSYALSFRESLLREAEQGAYISQANSIKWGQFEAALRAHQFALIGQLFPDLFLAEDQNRLKAWFAQIHRRAMTTEWVDWLYAIAYRKLPEGPYENQEIGAGLLAILANTGLADPDLSDLSASYLATEPLGWQNIFRNTDDVYAYQAVWLANAWWIYNYRQTAGLATAKAQQNIQLSYLWLLSLALPTGESPPYNLRGLPSLAEQYLTGAFLLDEPRLTWLADRSLRQRMSRIGHLHGRFTLGHLDVPAPVLPDIGSCLIFGNSGIPTMMGPLAPDKVVFRDGWADDATYALLNLRFSGWHRYKGTNTLNLLYQNGPLVTEKWTSDEFGWLPEGRGAFRDKRIPRENLNGLLLPQSGLARVLWSLSGIGSQWRQDPPAYAEVEAFFTSDIFDSSQTIITDWQGWRHERTIYLIHSGLVLVVDQAQTDNTASGPAALIWHLNGTGSPLKNGLRLDNSHRPARLVWPENAGQSMALKPETPSDSFLRNANWELLYTAPEAKQLNLATAFLTDTRTEGEMTLTFINESNESQQSQGLRAVWQNAQERVLLLHNNSGRYLADTDLATDGLALVLAEGKMGEDSHLCYVGGQTISVTPSRLPERLLTGTGETLSSAVAWHIDGKQLIINLAKASEKGCLILR